jgi:nucleoside-diphosphate-sugar epimerase
MINNALSKVNDRPTVVVLGGGGFVGARLAQMNSIAGSFKLVPLLRSYRGLARLGYVVPDACVADTKNEEALFKSFQGAQTVVNMTMGDTLGILADTQLVYSACARAGVRQLIHISSAVVLGRVTDPATHDDSPPDTKSWMLYARGKANAEVWLRGQFGKNAMQIVVLRPGLIWGPTSNWSEMVGDQLQRGKAILSNKGEGIANLIFVDNLAKIILAVAARPEAVSGFYNVADREVVSWKDYYTELAKRIGYDPASVVLWPGSRLRIRSRHVIEWALEQAFLFRLAKNLQGRLGPVIKRVIKEKLRGSPEPPGGLITRGVPPILSRATWVLHNTVNRLPAEKVIQDFGPLELIPFAQALDATAKWLKYAGYSATISSGKDL